MLKDANAIYTTAGLGYLERLLKFPFVICLMLDEYYSKLGYRREGSVFEVMDPD